MSSAFGANPPGSPFAPESKSDWDKYFDLRWRVLRSPWNQPRGSEKDDLEATSFHLMIAGTDSEALAVGRLHFNSPAEAQIRYMAVAPEAQGHRLGSVILRELETRARAEGANWIVLNAREKARPFYERHGYLVIGPAPTLFDAITHFLMRKTLTPAAHDKPARA